MSFMGLFLAEMCHLVPASKLQANHDPSHFAVTAACEGSQFMRWHTETPKQSVGESDPIPELGNSVGDSLDLAAQHGVPDGVQRPAAWCSAAHRGDSTVQLSGYRFMSEELSFSAAQFHCIPHAVLATDAAGMRAVVHRLLEVGVPSTARSAPLVHACHDDGGVRV